MSHMARPWHIAVMASGRGTLLPALVDLCRLRPADFAVACVVCNMPDAPVLALASRIVPAAAQIVIPHREFADRGAFEAAMLARMRDHTPDLVVLAGFRRLLTRTFLAGIGCPTINVHPSLLPAFPGMDAPAQALAAGAPETGCTVHYVDEGMDTGPTIAQRRVAVLAGDTAASLHQRIASVEAPLLCEAIIELRAIGRL